MRAWILACLLVAGSAYAAVSPPFIANGESEPIVRVDLLQDSAATNPAEPLAGLTHDSTGLAVSCIASPQSTWTDYTVAGTDQIESITTIGTYAAPTADNVRFAEVESEGVYELQFEASLFNVTDSNNVTCKISGATDLATRTFTMYQGLAEADANGRFAADVEAWDGTALATTDPVADVQTDTTAILADTNELQADWANGGRLDLILDARASQASVDGLNDFDPAADTVTVSDLVASAIADFFEVDSGTTAGAAVAGSVVDEIVSNSGGGGSSGAGSLELVTGTCDGDSTTTQCDDATNLTQADDYWNNWTAIIVDGQPPRCVRNFDATDDRLSWPAATALPDTAANQTYTLVAAPECRNFP